MIDHFNRDINYLRVSVTGPVQFALQILYAEKKASRISDTMIS